MDGLHLAGAAAGRQAAQEHLGSFLVGGGGDEVDAIRRREWLWAVFIALFSGFSAVLYFFLVYRAAPSATQGFELPGAHHRRRIKELEAQIHHLDKAHHHSQLGDIYFQQGKLAKAEACYRAALERDAQDLDPAPIWANVCCD